MANEDNLGTGLLHGTPEDKIRTLWEVLQSACSAWWCINPKIKNRELQRGGGGTLPN